VGYVHSESDNAASMRHILRFLFRRLSRGRQVARGPIIFDFINDRVYRAKRHPQRTMESALSPRRRRVVKRVEGIPPQAIRPKP
jgi:hypothetical protein